MVSFWELIFVLVFNWNHFEMRLFNLRINFYLLRTFPPHLGSFCVVSSFHYVSAKVHLWPSSGVLPRPRIGMLSLVTVSLVITTFHSCCLSHHVFDQVNLWPAWVGFETAIFWQCSPGTEETQRLYLYFINVIFITLSFVVFDLCLIYFFKLWNTLSMYYRNGIKQNSSFCFSRRSANWWFSLFGAAQRRSH